jgi:murein DD-endopeptidase MepM/ murein hydrolase activator NlpD
MSRIATATSAAVGLSSLLALLVPASAGAHTSGGTAAPTRPQIESLKCGESGDRRCARGDVLEVDGEFLAAATQVVFLGAAGRSDNRPSRPAASSAHQLQVRVPRAAVSGPIRVRARAARPSRRNPAIRVAMPVSAVTPLEADASAFPVLGRFSFGTFVNAFGGGRGHQGQDILADCGTPVVAARGGTVEAVKWQSAAGNYAVMNAADGSSHAYMHLLEPSSLQRGDEVSAGQRIGRVGQTGRASACHVHFELWTAPGWYQGGEPIDPLPFLRRLARAG